jgi:3-hydroxyacyl-CoA dehydrogenase
MSETVRYEVKDRVAVIMIDNPPVNAFSPEIWHGIDKAVARGIADEGADAIVLMGAGSTFSAGADIKVFDVLKTREDSMAHSAFAQTLLRRVEDSTKPLVAAVRGNTLGGGFEVAQACHFRVATKDAKFGQPEVLLGIIPAAGGTQRLPRLCGAELALAMCIDGKPIVGSKALTAGIVDHVIDGDLLTGAIAFAKTKARLREIRKVREITRGAEDVKTGLAACNDMRAALASAAKRTPAPIAAVNAIEAGIRLAFDAGLLRERELFAECMVSIESRALRHMFFAEREAAKVPDVPKDTAIRDIKQAAVVGAGTMGGGIAMTYANAGIPVLLKDVDRVALQQGLAAVRKNYEVTMSKGKVTAEQIEKTMALITPTTSYDGFDKVDIVVEAVFENLDLKKATFAELGAVTQPHCVLASNSSTLDIDLFAKSSGRPALVLGHHFFSPANVMKLLEIVRGRETSKEVIATSLKLAKRLGKVGVVVGNCFGFVSTRMLTHYLREAYLLLEEGASVSQIDGVLTEFGLPVGPFAMQDISGIDIGAHIRQYQKSIGESGAGGPQSAIPDRLFEMGRYGQKTGVGWYKYDAPGSRIRTPDPLIDQMAEEEAAKRHVRRQAIADDEIIARIMTALANEGARVLDEKYATRAGDIDVIHCYGFGFPRYRGGPMFYADTVGLPNILRRVQSYRARFGDYWKPAQLLESLVAAGRGFY